jgi:predicted adenylyl cyclase CyaB
LRVGRTTAMLEIELKARVEYPELVERMLGAVLAYAGEVDKRDEYWSVPLVDPSIPSSGFRLRIRTEPGRTTVTFKEKTYDGVIEVNHEVEFGILDPGAFKLFLGKMSGKLVYGKSKKGKMWKGEGGILAELVSVEDLGLFLEVETLREDSKNVDLDRIKARLMQIVEQCGLDESDLEPLPYSQLLGMSGY